MIQLKNETTGEYIFAQTGFSWTVLFFGPLVPLTRGDFIYFLLFLIAGLITSGLSNIFFAFFYNVDFIKRKKMNGFEVV